MDSHLESLRKVVEEVDRVLEGLFEERVSFDIISEYLQEVTEGYDREVMWRLFVLTSLERILDRTDDERR